MHGDLQTYCGDPSRRGPDAAGGYGDPVAVSDWMSSETGAKVGADAVARASYIISRYGQTTVDARAAAVDAAVYDLLAGGSYGINGSRGKTRLAYPVVSPTSRTLALQYLDEARRLAGPYELHVRPKVTETAVGTKVSVDLSVTSKVSGAKIPGVRVAMTAGDAHGSVTTGADGTATWDATAAKAGKLTVKGVASGLPGAQLKKLDPKDSRAQRMLLAGDTASVAAEAPVDVKPATGGVTLHKSDPEGSRMVGAAFQLLSGSKVVAEGKTDSSGVLTFKGLAAGTYRLHETSSGSNLHGTVPDQDVVIVAGQDGTAKPVVVVDPFKPADLTLKKLDRKTGKPLAGAVINVLDDAGGKPGTKKVAEVTTDAAGIAKVKIGMDVKAGQTYWAKEVKAPAKYQLNGEPQSFKATPGAAVSLTMFNDPKPARLTVLKVDKADKAPLAGMGWQVSTVKVDSDGNKVPGTKVASGTTGKDGKSAPVNLDALVDTGIEYLLTETKAPAGYERAERPVPITARADEPVDVRVENTRAATPPAPETPEPSTAPTSPAAPSAPGKGGNAPAKPTGSLAATGAELSVWVAGGAGLLVAAGGATVWATRRRRASGSTSAR
ncbi:SpaA isopeptide-forming pilin-related protein [Streptomyces sp. BI20]|uniref:SpaA isopeptide-forming pilin-related protein n=1 Tax=Streptomyces sp. BI20 TaxID=3403460 RepID=UPI003C718401